MSNKTYDVLKWVAMLFLPALTTFYGIIGNVWGLPYTEQVVETIAAIDGLLASCLGISTIKYKNSSQK